MTPPQPLRSTEAPLATQVRPAPSPSAMRPHPVPQAEAQPTVLLLQGPASPFWSVLGQAFARSGARVVHVNLSLGDWLFWRGPGTTLNYRGSLGEWEDWLEALALREGVSDILYFADRLPYHIAAQRIAGRREGLRVWAVENGYLRPDWITLEPFAMGRHSRFTRDPGVVRLIADGLDEVQSAPLALTPAYGHSFAREASSEVLFNLAHVFGRFVFPRYVTDKAVWPVIEYLGWVPRLWRGRREQRLAKAVERACIAGSEPVAIVALQMETDYQVRASSDYRSQRDMLAEVIASFARHAPQAMRLIVKIHPCDSGLIDWRGVASRLARREGVGDRVTTIQGGNFAELMRAAHGIVTINSTSGVSALALGCPVQVLGDAVYDLPGLTHQGRLDSFWTAPDRPDPALFDAWSRAAAALIQIRGSFFHPKGQQDAAAEIVRRVRAHRHYWRLWRDPHEGGGATP